MSSYWYSNKSEGVSEWLIQVVACGIRLRSLTEINSFSLTRKLLPSEPFWQHPRHPGENQGGVPKYWIL